MVSRSGTEAGRVDLIETGGAERRLEIVIGRPEAAAIARARRGEAAPRPSSWDLLKSAVEALGAQVRAVVITEVEDGGIFRAELVVAHGEEEHRLPARPSDAIAVAVRCPAAAIFVEEAVLDRAGMPSGPSTLPTP